MSMTLMHLFFRKNSFTLYQAPTGNSFIVFWFQEQVIRTRSTTRSTQSLSSLSDVSRTRHRPHSEGGRQQALFTTCGRSTNVHGNGPAYADHLLNSDLIVFFFKFAEALIQRCQVEKVHRTNGIGERIEKNQGWNISYTT